MSCKDPKPLNGNKFDKGTSCRSNSSPNVPEGTQTEKHEKFAEAEKKVAKAIHGLVFDLVPDTANPSKWKQDSSVLAQVLLKDNIFEEVLKKYLEKVYSGSIEISMDGKVSGKHEFQKKTPDTIFLDATSTVFKDRLKKTKQVELLTKELKGLGSLYGVEIKEIFVNKDWTKMFVVVATGLIAGGIVVGLVDTARETKNDTLGSIATGLANLVPETLYEVGSLKLGHTDIEWTPSKGVWKSSIYLSGEWDVHKNVKLKGRVEVLGSEKGAKGKGEFGATYLVGRTYLDSVEGKVTGLTDGEYELHLQLNKKISAGKEAQWEAFIGARYKGNYNGDPSSDRGSAAVLGGIKLKFNGP